MAIFFYVSKQRTPGPEVAIDCPACKSSLVLANTATQVETAKLFFVIPLFTHHNTILRCQKCNSELISRLSIQQLHEKSPEQINRSIVPTGGLLVAILFLASLFFCWIPILNLVIAATVPVANYQSRGANKLAGYIPLVVALGFNCWLAWAVITKG